MTEPRSPSSRLQDNKSTATSPDSDDDKGGRSSFNSLIIPVVLLGIAFALSHDKHIVSSVTTKCHAFLSMFKNPNASQQDSESMSSSDIIAIRNRPPHHLFTAAELSRYVGKASTHDTQASGAGKKDSTEKNASAENRILLAIAGIVVDVTKGARIYGPGGSYHHFAGRDATRSFASGDFSKDGLRSDLEGLAPQDLRSILHWVVFLCQPPHIHDCWAIDWAILR